MNKIPKAKNTTVKKAHIIVILSITFLFCMAGYAYWRISGLSSSAVPIISGEANIDYSEPSVEITGNTPSGSDENQQEEDSVATGVDAAIYLKTLYDEDVINVLVVGRDVRQTSSERGRSDTMMLLSYNSEKRKAEMISLLRDTLIPIDGYGWNRLNSAYSLAGIGLCVNTINANFDLDIQQYIIVDFDSMKDLVDEIGGIDITLTNEEANYYNKKFKASVSSGVNHVDGKMALIHARNRSVGGSGDFERTRRQRDIMLSIYKKVAADNDIALVTKLIGEVLDEVETNMSATQIIALAADVITGSSIDITQGCLPNDGTWQGAMYEGMSVLKIDIEANKEYLHKLIYEN